MPKISDNEFPKHIFVPQTSFPSTPEVGTVVMRSDLNYDMFFWDGTRWLSRTIYRQPVNTRGQYAVPYATGAKNIADTTLTPGTGSIYLDSVQWASYVNTTNDGSNYWTLEMTRWLANTLVSTGIGSRTTASDGATQWVTAVVSVQTTYDETLAEVWTAKITSTGTPGTIFCNMVLNWRKVAT